MHHHLHTYTTTLTHTPPPSHMHHHPHTYTTTLTHTPPPSHIHHPPHTCHYRLIISDLNVAFRMLDNCYDQPAIQLDGETSYNPIDIQAAAIFDLTVLSHVSNTSKAVIGVSVVFSGGGNLGIQSSWILEHKCDDDISMMMASFSLQNDISCAFHGWWGGGEGICTEKNYAIASETSAVLSHLMARALRSRRRALVFILV